MKNESKKCRGGRANRVVTVTIFQLGQAGNHGCLKNVQLKFPGAQKLTPSTNLPSESLLQTGVIWNTVILLQLLEKFASRFINLFELIMRK